MRRCGFALAILCCKLRIDSYWHCPLHIRMPAMSVVSEDESFLRMNVRIREVAASLRMAEIGREAYADAAEHPCPLSTCSAICYLTQRRQLRAMSGRSQCWHRAVQFDAKLGFT